MVASPKVIVNLTLFNARKDCFAYHIVVKPPTFIFFAAFVPDVPETVLYLPRVQFSESIAEPHISKIGERLSLFWRKASHILVSLRVKNIYFLMGHV